MIETFVLFVFRFGWNRLEIVPIMLEYFSVELLLGLKITVRYSLYLTEHRTVTRLLHRTLLQASRMNSLVSPFLGN